MARNTSGLRPWKPGQSGNPKGRKKLDPELKRLRQLTQDQFKELIQLALDSNVKELKKIAEHPSTSALKVGICTALHKAIAKGDWKTLKAIVEKIVGPDTIKIDHTTDGKPIGAQVHLYVPANGSTKEENENEEGD